MMRKAGQRSETSGTLWASRALCTGERGGSTVGDVSGTTDGGSLPDGVNRRTALKAAVGVGVGAMAWSAPRIDTLGMAPAGAAHFGSQCVILSPESDDKNSQLGQNFCPSPAPQPCCGQSFGNAGQVERFIFNNPTPTCTQLVVRTMPLTCDTASNDSKNPDVGQFAVVIESTSGTCDCTIFDAVLVQSSQRTIVRSLNNGPACGGIDASILDCDQDLVASSRLAVRITCQAGVGCT